MLGAAFLDDPEHIGAVAASGVQLSRKMAECVPWHACAPLADSFVVELGAGTGPITAALIDRGVPIDRFITVERSPELARALQARFPFLHVINGDALALQQIVEQCVPNAAQANVIVVSGLPFRSLPQDEGRAIARQIAEVTRPDGCLIQFTYGLILPTHAAIAEQFNRCDTAFVWCNIPPARVDVFRPRAVDTARERNDFMKPVASAGAGILFYCPEDSTVLLLLRSQQVTQPGVWDVPGGGVEAVDEQGTNLASEILQRTAVRETIEEAGSMPETLGVVGYFRAADPTHTKIYDLYIMPLRRAVKLRWPIRLSWEHDRYAWFPIDRLPEQLHAGVRLTLQQAGLVR